MTQNIFGKVCSHCMAPVAFDATECTCGHSFEFDKPDLTHTAEVIRAEVEEQLYETYLQARLEQTLTNLRQVRDNYGTGKWTTAQLATMQGMLREIETIKQQLTAQRQKTSLASEEALSARRRRAQRQTLRLASNTAMPVIGGYSKSPTERFRDVQSQAAQRATGETRDARLCPNCYASVAADLERCGCGYELISQNQMPALELVSVNGQPTRTGNDILKR